MTFNSGTFNGFALNADETTPSPLIGERPNKQHSLSTPFPSKPRPNMATGAQTSATSNPAATERTGLVWCLGCLHTKPRQSSILHPIPSATTHSTIMSFSSNSNPSAPPVPVPDTYGSVYQYNSNPDPYAYHRPAQYNTPPQQQGSYQGGYPPPSSSSSSSYYGYGEGQQQPGIDPELLRAFQTVDRDRSGFVDDIELQQALSSAYQRFSLRTIRLMMFLFRNHLDNSFLRLGFNEFAAVWNCLGLWRSIFERYDTDRSGKMDATELRNALLSVGFAVPPSVLHLLLSYCGSSSANKLELNFDNFVEVGMIVKGLTEKFKEKDTQRTGSASLQYETFMSMVLPFMVTYD